MNTQSNGNIPFKDIADAYNDIRPYEYEDPAQARRMLDELQPNLHEYTGSSTNWFNLQSVAARVRNGRVEMALIQRALELDPENVDLLCALLQCYYASHENLPKAAEVWQRLQALPEEKRNPNWRYWDFGAIYHAVILNDPDEGVRLLDAGQKYVRRDQLLNLFTSYRRILLDSVPLKSERHLLEQEDGVAHYQQAMINRYEKALLKGLDIGIENGHVLALNLATLNQERAGESEGSKKAELLDKALKYLDIAQASFTGVGRDNHPLYEIYIVRAKVLVALERYDEALNYIDSVPRSARLNDPNISSLRKLALLRTGRKDEPEISSEMLIKYLSQDGGQLLLDLAQRVPAIRATLMAVAMHLQNRGAE